MKRALIALALVGLLFFGFFAARNAYKEVKRNQQIQAEIESLEQEAENLKKNNQNLREKITYFETKDFQELEAKRELGFQKTDENVVIVKPNLSRISENISKSETEDLDSPKTITTNYLKWYNLFFK